jgi:tRNA_anti-like
MTQPIDRCHLVSMAGVAFCLLLVGCSGKKEEKRTEDKTEVKRTKDKQGGTQKDTEPDVRVTAKQLGSEFKKDPKTTGEKYKGLVEVTGTVRNFSGYIEGNFRLTLEGEEPDGGVSCMIEVPSKPWTMVSIGQTAKIHGKLKKGGGPELIECKIVEASGTATPSLKVEELSRLWASDFEGVKKRFKKPVILEGEISKVEKGSLENRVKITFKTPEKVKPVWTETDPDLELRGKKLNAGDTVKLLVELPPNPKDEYVYVVVAFLLD